MLRISVVIFLIGLFGNNLFAQNNAPYSYDKAGIMRLADRDNFDKPIKIKRNKENEIVYQFERLRTTSLDELKTAIDNEKFYGSSLTLKIDPNANFDIASFNSMVEREYESSRGETRFHFKVILEDSKDRPAGLGLLKIPFLDQIDEYNAFLDKYGEQNEIAPDKLKKIIISIRKDDISIDGESVDIKNFSAKLAQLTKTLDKLLVILSPESDVGLLRLCFFKTELTIIRHEKLNKTAMYFYDKPYNHLPDVLQKEVEMDAGFYYTIAGLSGSIQD